MAKKSKKDIDFSALQESISRQFRNLDPKDPSLWPVAPKILLCLFISIAVAVVLWFAKINEYEVELETEIAKEQTLRQDYQEKLTKAV
ncbi:MAG: pilus assembly protein PilO, partial [Betaproteobacteria bacterium]